MQMNLNVSSVASLGSNLRSSVRSTLGSSIMNIIGSIRHSSRCEKTNTFCRQRVEEIGRVFLERRGSYPVLFEKFFELEAGQMRQNAMSIIINGYVLWCYSHRKQDPSAHNKNWDIELHNYMTWYNDDFEGTIEKHYIMM